MMPTSSFLRPEQRMPPSVQLNAAMHAEALRIATERVDKGMLARFGGSRADRIRFAKTGALGELAFEQLLAARGVQHHTTIRVNQGADAGDFFLPDATGASVDVKIAETRKVPAPQWPFGIPVTQEPWKKDVVVIGWWNPGTDVVSFYGSISGGKLANRVVTKTNTWTKADYLTDNIEVFWRELDRTFSHVPGLV